MSDLLKDRVLAAAIGLTKAEEEYTRSAVRYAWEEPGATREDVLMHRKNMHFAMERLTEAVAAVTERRRAGVTREAVDSAASKLTLCLNAYVDHITHIVEGDDSERRQELALEWRENAEKALEEVDELRARMAQAKEDRDAYEF